MSSPRAFKRPITPPPCSPPDYCPAAKRVKRSPPTPPPSDRSSPSPSDHIEQLRDCSPELPLEILKQILTYTLPVLPSATVTNHLDPRILNPFFDQLQARRALLTRLQCVSQQWRLWCRDLRARGPQLVFSYQELARLAGGRWGDGKGKQISGQMGKKGKIWEQLGEGESQARKATELVCWMSPLPSEPVGEDAEVSEVTTARWPKWYLDDYLRHDLRRLGVQVLRVVAPNSATLASVLNSTIPHSVSQSFLTLHLEIHHPITSSLPESTLFPPSRRFYHIHSFRPTTDHLCPRLSLHRLQNLHLRNIRACGDLICHPTNLLQISFVSTQPGLCSPTTDPNVANHKAAEFRWMLTQSMTRNVLCSVVFDVWRTSLTPSQITSPAVLVAPTGTARAVGQWKKPQWIHLKYPTKGVMTAIDPIWEFLAAGVPGWECVKKQREQQKHGGDDEMDWSGEEDGEVEDEGVEADDDDDDDDDNYYDDDYDCSDGERETVTERTPRYRPARPIIPMGYSIVNGRTESGKVEQWLIPKGGEVELQIAQHQQQQQQKRLHPKSRPLRIR